MDRVTAASSKCQPSLHARHADVTAAVATVAGWFRGKWNMKEHYFFPGLVFITLKYFFSELSNELSFN